MVSRRQFIRMSMATACFAAALGWTGAQHQVKAQDVGKGGGSGSAGRGNSGATGNAGGSSNGSGDRGRSNGGAPEGSGSRGSSRDKGSPQSSGRVDGRPKDARDVNGSSSLTVQHRTGIKELIRRGRYIMLDKRGRTIINRKATNADRQRLLSLVD
jgi:hypothetical protein